MLLPINLNQNVLSTTMQFKDAVSILYLLLGLESVQANRS